MHCQIEYVARIVCLLNNGLDWCACLEVPSFVTLFVEMVPNLDVVPFPSTRLKTPSIEI